MIRVVQRRYGRGQFREGVTMAQSDRNAERETAAARKPDGEARVRAHAHKATRAVVALGLGLVVFLIEVINFGSPKDLSEASGPILGWFIMVRGILQYREVLQD